jgi:hypothetical protein
MSYIPIYQIIISREYTCRLDFLPHIDALPMTLRRLYYINKSKVLLLLHIYDCIKYRNKQSIKNVQIGTIYRLDLIGHVYEWYLKVEVTVHATSIGLSRISHNKILHLETFEDDTLFIIYIRKLSYFGYKEIYFYLC